MSVELTTPIRINKENRRVLAHIKYERGFRSYDDVILHLLVQAGYVRSEE